MNILRTSWNEGFGWLMRQLVIQFSLNILNLRMYWLYFILHTSRTDHITSLYWLQMFRSTFFAIVVNIEQEIKKYQMLCCLKLNRDKRRTKLSHSYICAHCTVHAAYLYVYVLHMFWAVFVVGRKMFHKKNSKYSIILVDEIDISLEYVYFGIDGFRIWKWRKLEMK